MDLNAIKAVFHNPYAMLAIGVATGNRKELIHHAVLAVFKIPILRRLLIGNPQKAKQALEEFVAEIDADIDALAKDQAAAAAQTAQAAAAAPAAPAPAVPAGPAPRP